MPVHVLFLILVIDERASGLFAPLLPWSTCAASREKHASKRHYCREPRSVLGSSRPLELELHHPASVLDGEPRVTHQLDCAFGHCSRCLRVPHTASIPGALSRVSGAGHARPETQPGGLPTVPDGLGLLRCRFEECARQKSGLYRLTLGRCFRFEAPPSCHTRSPFSKAHSRYFVRALVHRLARVCPCLSVRSLPRCLSCLCPSRFMSSDPVVGRR